MFSVFFFKFPRVRPQQEQIHREFQWNFITDCALCHCVIFHTFPKTQQMGNRIEVVTSRQTLMNACQRVDFVRRQSESLLFPLELQLDERGFSHVLYPEWFKPFFQEKYMKYIEIYHKIFKHPEHEIQGTQNIFYINIRTYNILYCIHIWRYPVFRWLEIVGDRPIFVTSFLPRRTGRPWL